MSFLTRHPLKRRNIRWRSYRGQKGQGTCEGRLSVGSAQITDETVSLNQPGFDNHAGATTGPVKIGRLRLAGLKHGDFPVLSVS
jgi:hypothetical protein